VDFDLIERKGGQRIEHPFFSKFSEKVESLAKNAVLLYSSC
jgi:hypothetical protein